MLIALAGCRQILGLDSPTLADATSGDAGGDAGLVTDAPAGCYGASPYTICLAQTPTDSQSYSDGSLDTQSCSTGTAMMVNGTSVCVIAARTITVSGRLVISGVRPLALLATGDLRITGTIDASGVAIGSNGSVPSGCSTTAADGASNVNGAGGGAGGSFGSTGGNGGSAGGGGGAGGHAAAPVIPATLQPGCPGGHGGAGSASTSTPGRGGGALYLLGGITLMIASGAIVDASGTGGAGGRPSKGGGAGGGSGGMILLWSPALTNAGSVFANGGGGGAGADNLIAGNSGGSPSQALVAAAGGTSAGSTAGNGGNGSVLNGNGQNGSSGSSGGGGGGGAGVIRILSSQTSIGGSVSPPPS